MLTCFADSSAPKDGCYEYLPDTNKVSGYQATERLLEPLGEGFTTGFGKLIKFVCEGGLLRIIFRE